MTNKRKKTLDAVHAYRNYRRSYVSVDNALLDVCCAFTNYLPSLFLISGNVQEKRFKIHFSRRKCNKLCIIVD